MAQRQVVDRSRCRSRASGVGSAAGGMRRIAGGRVLLLFSRVGPGSVAWEAPEQVEE